MEWKDFTIKYPGRCNDCFMHEDLCLCTDFTSFATRMKLTLIMHHREAYKTTNTGRICHLSLPNSRILLRGHPVKKLQLENYIPQPEKCLFLCLSEKSRCLSSFSGAEFNDFDELVVPDGNWNQASKVGRREPLVQKMTWVKLPPGELSQYHLRREPQAEGLATMEAISRAYGLIEGPEPKEYLDQIFQTMVQRTLKTRPKNRQEQNLLSR